MAVRRTRSTLYLQHVKEGEQGDEQQELTIIDNDIKEVASAAPSRRGTQCFAESKPEDSGIEDRNESPQYRDA